METKNELPESLKQQLNDILKDLLEKKMRPANEIILDDVDLRELLNVSRRTTLNYRASGKLKYFKVEQKNFYFLSDIISFIKTYAEEA